MDELYMVILYNTTTGKEYYLETSKNRTPFCTTKLCSARTQCTKNTTERIVGRVVRISELEDM